MAALVQSYPQQSSTVTMLQTRPSSASGILQASSQNSHQYPTNPTHGHRNSFHGLSNGMGGQTYRGQQISPVAPYAFTTTPSLTTTANKSQGGPHLRTDQRTTSAPSIQTTGGGLANRSRYPAAASISTTSSSSSSDVSAMSHQSGSKDDSSIANTSRSTISLAARPQSAMFSSTTPPTLGASSSSTKPTPDRYRRPNNRRADTAPPSQGVPQISLAATMPNVMQFYGASAQQSSSASGNLQAFTVQMPPLTKQSPNSSPTVGAAADDLQISRHSDNQARRYRRRSIHTIEPSDHGYEGGNSYSTGLQKQGSRQVSSASGRIDHQQHPLRSSPIPAFRPGTSHGRNASSESVNSTRSGPSSRPGSVSSIPPHQIYLMCDVLKMHHNWSTDPKPLFGSTSLTDREFRAPSETHR